MLSCHSKRCALIIYSDFLHPSFTGEMTGFTSQQHSAQAEQILIDRHRDLKNKKKTNPFMKTLSSDENYLVGE